MARDVTALWHMLAGITGSVLLLALTACQRDWQPHPPPYPDEVTSLAQLPSTRVAVSSRGRLWLFQQHGEFAPAQTTVLQHGRVVGHLNNVTLLGEYGGDACVLRRTPDETLVRIECFDGSVFREVAQTHFAANDYPLRFFEAPGRLGILGGRSVQILDVAGGRWWRRSLSEPLRSAGSMSAVMLPDGRTLYAGADIGEFGAGLWRIDTISGTVQPVERDVRHDICGYPADIDCDAVSGVVLAPGRPECVIASIDNSTIGEGRLIRVCNGEVEVLLRRNINVIGGEMSGIQEERFSGLVTDGEALWAATPHSLFEIRGSTVTRTDLRVPTGGRGPRIAVPVPGVTAVWLEDTIRGSEIGWLGPMLVSTH